MGSRGLGDPAVLVLGGLLVIVRRHSGERYIGRRRRHCVRIRFRGP
jgi:hypothetical protein